MRILITGAASGIGYELGCELIKRGHTVYMTTENVQQLYILQDKLKKNNIEAICFKMDITTDDILLVDNIIIDCLINHAGIGISGSILNMDIDVLRKNYDVNVFASFNLLQRVYKNMVKKHIKGKIFVTSSAAAYLSLPFLGCYTSSKAAITMLCKTLKRELEYLDSDISISVIEPGAYHTGFNQRMIESKNMYLEKKSIFYRDRSKINRLQKNLFRLLEKDDYSDLVEKVISEVECNSPKFMIRRPWYINIFLRIYFLFWY